jgi:hypothetical protein
MGLMAARMLYMHLQYFAISIEIVYLTLNLRVREVFILDACFILPKENTKVWDSYIH